MKRESWSMNSSSSVREPAAKNRRQNKQRLLPQQPGALPPGSKASNRSLENPGENRGLEGFGIDRRSCNEAADPSTENVNTGSLSQGTVLFVSDDDYFRTTARAYLEHVGLAVRSCADAARVPELFFRKPAIDLLLVDVHAIGSTGLLLAAELTGFADDLPVIIISTTNGKNGTSAAISSHGWKFLSKPVLLPELLEAIHAALGRKSSPETSSTRKSPVAANDVSAPHSRRTAVFTEERRTTRRPSRLLVMQGSME
jgi:DNA-binding response OmpR family regulator